MLYKDRSRKCLPNPLAHPYQDPKYSRGPDSRGYRQNASVGRGPLQAGSILERLARLAKLQVCWEFHSLLSIHPDFRNRSIRLQGCPTKSCRHPNFQSTTRQVHWQASKMETMWSKFRCFPSTLSGLNCQTYVAAVLETQACEFVDPVDRSD